MIAHTGHRTKSLVQNLLESELLCCVSDLLAPFCTLLAVIEIVIFVFINIIERAL